MKNIGTLFAGREVELVDRRMLSNREQVGGLAEKGTWAAHLIYEPKSCGKTAFFKQASEVLGDMNI